MKWQTKTLAIFVAATVPLEKAGDVNPLLEAAQQIGEDGTEKSSSPAVDVSKPFDPENPPMPDNNTGSFERFLGSFGNPTRWAGR